MPPSSRHVALTTTLLASLAAALLAVASPAAAAPGDDDAPPDAPQASTWARPANACGTHQVPGLVVNPIQRHAAGPRTIFMNRRGGTYMIGSGPTNSATMSANRSVSANGQPRTAVIAPLAGDFNWTSINACVQAHFSKYDLRFTETRPSTGVYVEAIVGGNGTELGFGRDQLFGIAAADNFCGVTEAGIAFNFSETHRGVPQRDAELCATIAHEVGHLLALEHETLATDLMSYVLVSETSSKAFVNVASPCGVQPGQNQACSCSSGTTNSGARLASFVGLRPVETVPPALSVVSPGDGDRLPPTFDVIAEASDNLEMSDVTATIDGAGGVSDTEPDGDRYTMSFTGVADGDHTLFVRARDRAGNEVTRQLAITVARLPIGSDCTGGDQCAGGQCAMQGGEQFCTQTCDLANAASCPDGWTCEAAGANAVCAGGAGGCCDAGQRPGAGTGLLVLGVGLLVFRRRRRTA